MKNHFENIIGISAYYHDSAACIIKNGKIIAAVEEERFSRIKHDNSFPENSIKFCLEKAKLNIEEIDAIAYYEKPMIKFDRVVHMFMNSYPFSLSVFLKSFPEFVSVKINPEQKLRKMGFKGKIFYIPHHLAHASATFFTSPFKKSAILTVDGVGEWQTTGLYYGNGNEIYFLKKIDFPNSLGLLYSTITSFLGFKVNEDEYKVMGLSSYGKPKYYKKFLKFVKINDDGTFRLNMDYFAFDRSETIWSKKMEKLLGKPRKKDEKIKERHKNIAATLQEITEEIYLKLLNHLYSLTKLPNVCISGGVGLNALANGKIYYKTPFKKVHVFGAAGDNGASLGAALFLWNFLLNKPRKKVNNLYLGTEYSNSYIENFLKSKENEVSFTKLKNKDLVKKVANILSKNKVVGWFYGRMEFGPRALGARSILANPKPKWMKDRVNEIKRREPWRPFAGSVLQEKIHEYFNVPEKNHYSPFMIFAFEVKKEKRKEISAIVHVNNTCRIQTVNKRDNGIYYDLIKEFYKITKVPVILNTSFNLKGEPIVNKPEEAYNDFIKTNMDYLVLQNYLVEKLK